MKKCIAKKCEDCRLHLTWDMTNQEGLRNQMSKCVFIVIAEELPRLRGSVDGGQQASNETRNAVLRFGNACSQAFKVIIDERSETRIPEVRCGKHRAIDADSRRVSEESRDSSQLETGRDDFDGEHEQSSD